MTLKSYLWEMRLITLASIIALGLVVRWVDPFKPEYTGRILFYTVLFFALSGVLNLFFLMLRRKLLGGEAALATLGLTFRQAVLLTLLAIGLLVLQSFRMLLWWDALLVVAGIFLIELYFLSRS